jgi:hypothetical protein
MLPDFQLRQTMHMGVQGLRVFKNKNCFGGKYPQ